MAQLAAPSPSMSAHAREHAAQPNHAFVTPSAAPGQEPNLQSRPSTDKPGSSVFEALLAIAAVTSPEARCPGQTQLPAARGAACRPRNGRPPLPPSLHWSRKHARSERHNERSLPSEEDLPRPQHKRQAFVILARPQHHASSSSAAGQPAVPLRALPQHGACPSPTLAAAMAAAEQAAFCELAQRAAQLQQLEAAIQKMESDLLVAEMARAHSSSSCVTMPVTPPSQCRPAATGIPRRLASIDEKQPFADAQA